MKVLLVSDFVPPVMGGLETYVDALAAELAARDHEVHVATLTKSPHPAHPNVRYHSIGSLSQRVIRPTVADRPFAVPVTDPVAYRQLGAVISGIRPDVIHAHTWLGASVPRPDDTPFIMTAHEYSLICQLRTLWTSDGQRCPGPHFTTCVRCGTPVYGTWKSVALTSATVVGRRRLHEPDAFLVLSDRVKQALQPWVRTTIEVIPGFVHTPGRDGPRHDLPDLPETPFALFAGDPRPHKGIDLLNRIWSSEPPAGLALVVASARPAEPPLPRGVRTVSLRSDQMLDAWRRARLALVPSIWDEPFGMVAIEALSMGTPVVASDAGALPEIVRHEENGLVVPAGEMEPLRSAIARLGTDDGLHRRLSDGARQSATRYAPETVVPRIVDVYDRARRRGAGRRAQSG